MPRRPARSRFAGRRPSGCRQDMHDQPRSSRSARATSSPTGRARGRCPAHAVARGDAARGPLCSTPASRPTASSPRRAADAGRRATLLRARARAVRHLLLALPRPLGDGDGMVVQRGYKQPTSFHDDRLRQVAGRLLLRRHDRRLRRHAELRGAGAGRGPLGDRRLRPDPAARRSTSTPRASRPRSGRSSTRRPRHAEVTLTPAAHCRDRCRDTDDEDSDRDHERLAPTPPRRATSAPRRSCAASGGRALVGRRRRRRSPRSSARSSTPQHFFARLPRRLAALVHRRRRLPRPAAAPPPLGRQVGPRRCAVRWRPGRARCRSSGCSRCRSSSRLEKLYLWADHARVEADHLLAAQGALPESGLLHRPHRVRDRCSSRRSPSGCRNAPPTRTRAATAGGPGRCSA